MRIAYLLPDPGIPVGGVKGASVHVAEITRALARAGNRVLLVAMRAAGSAPDGVDLVVLDPGPLGRGPGGDAGRIAAVERFLAQAEPAIRAFGPDLLIERLSLFAGGGTDLARRLGVPRLVEINAPVTAERAGYQGVADATLGEQLERRALLGAHAVAVSPPLAEWARSRGVAHVTVVPNGVDVERFAPDPARAADVRRSFGIEGADVVGFAGSLKPWHGVDVLLGAAVHLADRRPRLRLLIVGDGPERAGLEAVAAATLPGRVHFAGPVPSAAMPAHLAAFDVATAPYVMPASGVGFYFSPLKVVEAMAEARPVVASRFGPIEDLLAGWGRLVPPGDPAALAVALDDALDDPRASELAAGGRRRATSTHAWSAVARRILAAAPRGAAPATSADGTATTSADPATPADGATPTGTAAAASAGRTAA